MDGSFTSARRPREPAWRRRVELWMETGRLTAVDVPVLGVVRHRPRGRHRRPPRARPVRPDAPRPRRRRRRGWPSDPTSRSAGALLDQRNVAGFGNVYAVELPFVVGVSPNQPVGTVDGLPDLLGLGAAVIRTNAARGPQNTTGRTPAARRPLDLRPAGPAVPAVRDPPRRLGRARQPVAAGRRCGARRASRSSPGAPSTSPGPAACWPCTRPGASRRSRAA